jgi:polysaccharide export outer membrane protein
MKPRALLALTLWLFAAAAAAQAQDRLEYRLGAGDNIRITVFQNPDLTLETRVSEEGTITYPLIGKLKVGGMTVAAAEQAIAKALKDGKFIDQPQVSILPLTIRSSQVSVLGQVGKPGRFPLETFNTKISEMIAIAGGISPAGADTIILTGQRGGKRYRKEIDVAAMFLYNRLDGDVTVAGGDVIYVDRAPLFYIYGEVQHPGSYRIERNMTIRHALVQGGGPTPRGTERGLKVHRRGADNRMAILTPELNDPVYPEDILFVQESTF